MPLTGPIPDFEAGDPVSAKKLQRLADGIPWQVNAGPGIGITRTVSGFTVRNLRRRSPGGGSLIPARITAVVEQMRPNVWLYRAKQVAWNFVENRYDPPADDAEEVDCYNTREAHNDGLDGEGEGITVGVVGSALVALKPIMVGCHVHLFRQSGSKPGGGPASETATTVPATVYLFEASNAVSVTCSR